MQCPTENDANNGRQYTTQTIKDLKKERSLVSNKNNIQPIKRITFLR
jgi:hypothetical protein